MDWIRFLDENNTHYVTTGPNTKRGEVSIRCPFCGGEDPSEHLGINLTSGYWGCFRDGSHRGKSPRTLVKALLGCSSSQAGLVVKQYSHADPDTLEATLAGLGASYRGTIMREPEAGVITKGRGLEQEFNAFTKIKVRGITRRFFDYLTDRGHDNPMEIIEHYGLRCALTGRYKDRIILPVRLNGELLGWTSRALGSPKNAPRYLMSNEDVKTTVYNYDEIKEGGNRLFIVEGPFDALKVDNYGRHVGIRATCTFGTSVAISQIALLRALREKYGEAYVMFDKGAEGPGANLAEWVKAGIGMLPHHVKDPGDLVTDDLRWMCNDFYNGLPTGIPRYTFIRPSTKTNALLTRLAKKT